MPKETYPSCLQPSPIILDDLLKELSDYGKLVGFSVKRVAKIS